MFMFLCTWIMGRDAIFFYVRNLEKALGGANQKYSVANYISL